MSIVRPRIEQAPSEATCLILGWDMSLLRQRKTDFVGFEDFYAGGARSSLDVVTRCSGQFPVDFAADLGY